MTISNTIAKVGPFAGNGVTTSFPFTFKTFLKADVKVVKTSTAGVESTLVLDADYSVALNADQNASPGGTVTYPISGTPLAVGEKLTLVSNAQALQGTNLANQGGFFPNNISDMADLLTILVHQLSEQSERTLKNPVSDSSNVGELPTAANRANMLLAFDPSGNPIAQQGVSAGTVLATAFWQAVLQLSTAAASLAALGGAAVASPTFTGTPAAPTAAADTNTTQLATTAFVLAQAAAATDQEAATSTKKYVTPAVQQRHPAAAKAWIKFAGDGTSISASYNVSSLTDNGTGDWTVNFTTAFSSANYGVATTVLRSGFRVALTVKSQLAGSCELDCLDVNAAAVADNGANYAVFFGDQ